MYLYFFVYIYIYIYIRAVKGNVLLTRSCKLILTPLIFLKARLTHVLALGSPRRLGNRKAMQPPQIHNLRQESQSGGASIYSGHYLS